MFASGALLFAFYVLLFFGLILIGAVLPDSFFEKIQQLSEKMDKKITRAYGVHTSEMDWTNGQSDKT